MSTTKNTKNTAAQKAAKFARLRQRAIDSGLVRGQDVKSAEDYVLGAELGFDPEIRVSAPSLEDMLVIQQAAQGGGAWDLALALFGYDDARRIVSVLDENLDGNAASQTLVGIVIDVTEHFYGPDALTTPEGFTSRL